MAEPGLMASLKERRSLVVGILIGVLFLLLVVVLVAVLAAGGNEDPDPKPLQPAIFKTPPKGKHLSLDRDIVSIEGIMQKLEQLDAEKKELTDETKATLRANLDVAVTEFLDHERATQASRFKLPHTQSDFETDRLAFQSRLLLAVQNSIGAAKQRTVGNSGVIDKLLEEMREDCDGRHSIDMLDDENCRDEDNDDLHKILALSNPFRRIDGWCNNLRQKSWGGAGTAFKRLASNAYDDGISKPRNVPVSPREVSNELHAANSEFSSVEANANASERVGPLSATHTSHMHMQFGQFLDHDISITPEAELDCCNEDFLKKDKKSKFPRCFNVPVTKKNFLGHSCFSFTRSDTTCNRWKKPVEQINGLTAFIDGSQIYGSDKKTSIKLRDQKRFGRMMFTSARLRTHNLFKSENLPRRSQCRFPTQAPQVPDGLTAGDVRVTIQPTLASIQTLFLKEHNRIAKKINPLVWGELRKMWKTLFIGWRLERIAQLGEELVYQIARQLVGAQLQNIVYRDYLPIVLGGKAYGDLGKTDTRYDPKVDPSVLNEFATVAFRYGHSQVLRVFQGVSRWSLEFLYFDRDGDRFVTGNLTAGERGTNWMHEMGGSSAQKAAASDLTVVDDLRNKLFFNINGGRPDDLVSRNIQRGRDHGIPSYSELRKICGMATLGRSAPPEIEENTWRKLLKVYKNNPRHIDPFTGGLAETLPADGSVGPLFACIIKKQFERLRDGDRFFFTHRADEKNSVRSLGPVGKKNVLKRGLASVLCDNVDAEILKMHKVGQNPFKMNESSAFRPIDCSRTPGFNFGGIVKETFERLGVGKLGQQSGEIKSPFHPKNYPSNWNKTYDLEVASGSAIELTFESFDLERPHSTRGCIWDWVEVFDGDGTVLMKRSCGSGLDRLEGLQREELKKVTSRSNRMSVEFHSDRRVTGTGFLAKWKKVAPPFGIAFSPPKNQVTSPDYPFNYPNNVISEEVEIGNPDGGGVHLTFDDFVLEESDGCELDFVQVLDENDKPISAKMCGSEIPDPIKSPGNMTVVFHSDSSDRFRGFRATWRPA